MNHGHEFDVALSAEHKAEQECKQAEREARKKLEAAAPDLLAACEKAQIDIYKVINKRPVNLGITWHELEQAIEKTK